jgi:hypothetical protein
MILVGMQLQLHRLRGVVTESRDAYLIAARPLSTWTSGMNSVHRVTVNATNSKNFSLTLSLHSRSHMVFANASHRLCQPPTIAR